MTSPNPSEVLALAADLVAAQQKVAILQARWDALFGGSPAERAVIKQTRVRSGNSLPAKALAVLDKNRDKEYTISEVSTAVGESDLAVGRALYRLFATGKISNPKRGIYQAHNDAATQQEYKGMIERGEM